MARFKRRASNSHLFTVMPLVTWSLSWSEAGDAFDLIQTSVLLKLKRKLVSIRTTWFSSEWKQIWQVIHDKVRVTIWRLGLGLCGWLYGPWIIRHKFISSLASTWDEMTKQRTGNWAFSPTSAWRGGGGGGEVLARPKLRHYNNTYIRIK